MAKKFVFQARLTKPGKGNKYYIRKADGGYSDAILGRPTDPECNVLANCSGYSYGRFNEVGQWGYCKYLAPVNAENFMDFRGECKTGMEPKLGACMVWQRGKTKSASDGAGHVASVEEVISPEEVVTSESSYGGEAFYVKHRKKGVDGRWGQGSDFTFLGFIYNPAVPESAPEREIKVGDEVTFTGHIHYVSSNGSVGYPTRPGKATVTKINPGAKHPYHLVRIKSSGTNVYGWVDAKDVFEAPKPAWEPQVGDVVYFKGGSQYQWQNGTVARQATAGRATITKIYKTDVKHPYHLIRIKGGSSDVWGFVDRDTFEEIKVGAGDGDI